MATVYYRQFSVLKIDADGRRVELPAEDVNVYNVTAATSLGTLTTDTDGIIVAGSFTATLFDVIEISHDTYPLTCRFTLQATEGEAFTALENNVACYIAENLYTDTTESKTAKLFVIDLDNAEVKPSFLTDVKPSEGIQKYIPQTASAQNLRIALISEDINGQLSTAEIATAPEYFDITIPAASGGGWTVMNLTASYTATSADSNTLFTNTGSGGFIYVDFSGLNAGDRFGLFVSEANTFRVDGSGANVYDFTVGSVSRLNCSTLYGYVEVVYDGVDFMVVQNRGFA